MSFCTTTFAFNINFVYDYKTARNLNYFILMFRQLVFLSNTQRSANETTNQTKAFADRRLKVQS